MPDTKIQDDRVSGDCDNNQSSGAATDVKTGEVSVTSHRGDEIQKMELHVEVEESGNNGSAEPANDDEKNSKAAEAAEEAKENGAGENKEAMEEEEKGENGMGQEDVTAENGTEKGDGRKQRTDEESEEDEDAAKTGREKRKAEQDVDGQKDDEAKKQKTANGTTNGSKKGPGRPRSTGDKKVASKKEHKTPVGKTERKTRSQGSV